MKNDNLCYTGKRQYTGDRNSQDAIEQEITGRRFPGAGSSCARSEPTIPQTSA